MQELVAECAAKYGNNNVHYVVADATSEADCKTLVEFTMEKFGKIDIAILAAGVSAHSLFKDIKDMNIVRKIMETNFMGAVMLTKYLLPILRHTKGQFVVISSASAVLPLPLRSAYCASKSAVNSFFDSIAVEEPDVSVTLVCPDSYSGSNFRNNNLIKSD